MKPTKTTPASTLGEQLTMASTRRLRRTVVGAVNLNNSGHRHPVSPAIRGPHRHAGGVWRSSSERAVACPVAKTRPVKCHGSGHHTSDRESVLVSVDVGSETRWQCRARGRGFRERSRRAWLRCRPTTVSAGAMGLELEGSCARTGCSRCASCAATSASTASAIERHARRWVRAQ
jgi:hypothetical protein